jgi:hypothetical protein
MKRSDSFLPFVTLSVSPVSGRSLICRGTSKARVGRGAMKAMSGLSQAGLVALIVGLTGFIGALFPGKGFSTLHFKADQGQGEAQVSVANKTFALTLKEGQITKVPEMDLTIEVREVRDFTSEGCLGGPVGCPDHVKLELTQRSERQQVILYVAHTQFQREQGVHQARVFGSAIALTALRGQQITLSIEKNR